MVGAVRHARLGTIGDIDPETGDPVRTGDILPDIAVDPASAAAALQRSWFDASFLNNNQADAIAFSQSARRRPYLVQADQGEQDPTGIPIGNQQAFTASVDVSANGTVAVTYYDFRNNTSSDTAPDGLLRRPLSSDLADSVHQPSSWINEAGVDDPSFDMVGPGGGWVLHRRLRGASERGNHVHGLLLAAAWDGSVQRFLPARRLRQSSVGGAAHTRAPLMRRLEQVTSEVALEVAPDAVDVGPLVP